MADWSNECKLKNIVVATTFSNPIFKELCEHCRNGELKDLAQITFLITNDKDTDIAKEYDIVPIIISQQGRTQSEWYQKFTGMIFTPPTPDLIITIGLNICNPTFPCSIPIIEIYDNCRIEDIKTLLHLKNALAPSTTGGE